MELVCRASYSVEDLKVCLKTFKGDYSRYNMDDTRSTLEELVRMGGEVTAVYAKKEILPGRPYGRMWPKGVSLAGLGAGYRKFFASYVEVDAVNSHPTIMRWLGHKAGLECPNFDRLVTDRKSYMDEWSKDMILKAVYLGNSEGGLAGLTEEASKIAEYAAGLEPEVYAECVRRAARRRSDPRSKFMGWFLGEIETKCTLILKEELEKAGFIEGEFYYYAYDGVGIKSDLMGKGYAELEEAMRSAERRVEAELEGLVVSFALKG